MTFSLKKGFLIPKLAPFPICQESNSWVAFPKTAHVSARKVIQAQMACSCCCRLTLLVEAGGVLLLAVTLIFAARGQASWHGKTDSLAKLSVGAETIHRTLLQSFCF